MSPTLEDMDRMTAARPRRGRARNVSMGTWLAIALLAVSILSLLFASVVSLSRASQLADGALEARARALLSLQSGEVERYLDSTRRTVAAIAATDTVVDATRRFESALAALQDNLEPDVVDAATSDLSAYYTDALVPELEVTSGQPVRLRRLLPEPAVSRYLQDLYVAADPDEGPSGSEIVNPGDGSAYSRVHALVQPAFADILARSDVEDIYLIAPDTGFVLYSATKLPDFATSLLVGPYSGSLLAQGFRAVQRAPDQGVVSTDLAPYTPLGGRPASFVLAPVLDDDRLVAVVAARVSTAEIDRITTVDGTWRDAGFGASGETFLVGPDGRMRSVSRAFVEDPDAYLGAVADAATATAEERAAMAAAETTAVYQQAFNEADMTAVSGEDMSFVATTGYLGEDVVTAFAPLDAPGVEWLLALQIDADEVAAPVDRYRRNALVALSVVVLLVSFAAVAWSRAMFRPLRAVSDRLRTVLTERTGGAELTDTHATREFADLATSVEDMIGTLERRRADVDAAIAERRAMVHAMLPDAIAERLDAGDRRVVDEIAQATVVVVTVNALGALLSDDDGAGRDRLDRLVADLDALAERHGLDRVKVLGDSYFAGCGLDRPYLDHAPRAVAFARAVTDGGEADGELGLSIGIASGRVMIGLTGSTLLVYDMWGETVDVAHTLAQTAEAGEILVSDRTHDLLPHDVPAAARDVGTPGTLGVWRIAEPQAQPTDGARPTEAPPADHTPSEEPTP